MNAHEAQQHNQSAFAAMHETLAALSDTRMLYCDTPQQYADMENNFRQLSIKYQKVTCHMADGRDAPGFRISVEAFIFLATAELLNTN